jgi:hypothetical protein
LSVSPLNQVLVPFLGRKVGFLHRKMMDNPHPLKRASAPRKSIVIPATTLPMDSTGGGTVSCPMDDNDTLGDCGPAMGAHFFNVVTFGQGKPGYTEVTVSVPALDAQYKQVSGGDNGTDEDMMVNQIMKVGLAGDPTLIITDALDTDITNIPLAQYLSDQFYGILMAWSVPDKFITGFASNTVWPDAMIPNPANGHFVLITDVGGSTTPPVNGISLNGFNRLWTWGASCWVGQPFIASVQPQCFVVFSPRQFSLATGYDSKGRHITSQAAIWASVGGNPIPSAVINGFPPISGPVPTPVPAPPPTPAPVPAPVPTPTPVVEPDFAYYAATKTVVFSGDGWTIKTNALDKHNLVFNTLTEVLTAPKGTVQG